MLGKIDRTIATTAMKYGVDLYKGSLRKSDGRVILSIRNADTPFKGCGYILRSRLVWWLHKDEVIEGLKFNIHHKNGNRSDDRIENLEKLTHLEHTRLHHRKGESAVERICINCGNKFLINSGRLREKGRGSFCSQKCYQEKPRTEKHRRSISIGLKRAYRLGIR